MDIDNDDTNSVGSLFSAAVSKCNHYVSGDVPVDIPLDKPIMDTINLNGQSLQRVFDNEKMICINPDALNEDGVNPIELYKEMDTLNELGLGIHTEEIVHLIPMGDRQFVSNSLKESILRHKHKLEEDGYHLFGIKSGHCELVGLNYTVKVEYEIMDISWVDYL